MYSRHRLLYAFLALIVLGLMVSAPHFAEAQSDPPLPDGTSLAGEWMFYPIYGRIDGIAGGDAEDLTLRPGVPVTFSVSDAGSRLSSLGPNLVFSDYARTMSNVQRLVIRRLRDGYYGLAVRTGSPDVFAPIVEINLLVVSSERIDVFERLGGYEGGGWMRGVLMRGTTDPRPEMLPYQRCPGAPAPHLAPGATFEVDYGEGLNLRDQPGPHSKRLAAVAWQATGQVLEGPQCAGSMAYWKVNLDDGQIGWLSEGSGTDYWLDATSPNIPELFTWGQNLHTSRDPIMEAMLYRLNDDGSLTLEAAITPTPEPPKSDVVPSCPSSVETRLRIGGKGTVLDGDANALNTKPASPSTDRSSERLRLIPPGDIFDVLDGPICESDLIWWKVRYQGVEGWTAEMKGDTYWLAPVP